MSMGATGKFPRGHLNADDEGQLTMGVAADPVKRVVVVDFGSPVKWMALPAREARRFAMMLTAKADELDGSTIDPELPS
jgi:hypothetical protein